YPSYVLFTLSYFFFQAEDGIRDFHVTGVQTCALPISERSPGAHGRHGAGAGPLAREGRGGAAPPDRSPDGDARPGRPAHGAGDRSEERRVGKEGRPRGLNAMYAIPTNNRAYMTTD